MSKTTNLSELAEFFPERRATVNRSAVRVVAMRQGETYEQDVKRQDEQRARIKQQIRAKAGAA